MAVFILTRPFIQQLMVHGLPGHLGHLGRLQYVAVHRQEPRHTPAPTPARTAMEQAVPVAAPLLQPNYVRQQKWIG